MQIRKVVLIDDEKLIRDTTAMLLVHHGYEVVTAAGGEEGIAAVRRHAPDLVLLDVMMPAMDGWEVLRRLKAEELTGGIEFVIFTASDLPVPEDVLGMFGRIEVLRKPVYIQRILELVRRKEKAHD